MQIKILTFLLILSLLSTACSEGVDSQSQPSAGTINVSIGGTQKLSISPLTSMDDDGQTIKWIAGDKIALWATNSANEMVLQAHPFVMYHYNTTFNSARFTADVPEMDPDTYMYYAASPMPDRFIGTTTATFNIPAVQNGERTLANDIMVGTPISGKALQSGDNSEALSFQFTHKIHVLKIRIPENKMGVPISALSLTFPVAVTGALEVDLTDPHAAPLQLVPTSDSKVLTLEFKEPKDAGDTVFAIIAPVEINPDEQIEIKAYTATQESFPTHMSGKNYKEGHTTPISLTIPKMYRITRILFSLDGDGTTTLGEKLNFFTLTGPEGIDLGTGSNSRSFPLNEQNEYEISYEGDFTDNLSGQPFTVSFDSENTLTSTAFTMPQLLADGRNTLDVFKVPYLMFEDFNSILSFGRDDNPGVGGTTLANGNKPVYNLSEADFGLSAGWTGTRVGGYANTAIRICGRWQGQSFTTSRDAGRLDSAPLRAIKDGKTVKVVVSFDFKGGRWSWSQSGTPNGNTVYSYGYTNNQNGMSGSEGIERAVGNDIIIPNTTHSNSTEAQTYADINLSNSFEIPNATNSARLSWKVTSTMDNKPFLGANANFWLYIDNVKVLITK